MSEGVVNENSGVDARNRFICHVCFNSINCLGRRLILFSGVRYRVVLLQFPPALE